MLCGTLLPQCSHVQKPSRKRSRPSWRELWQLPEALPPGLAGTTCSARQPQHRLVLASCPWHAVWIAKTLPACSCTALGGSWHCRFNMDSAPPPAPPVADQASADHHASASCHGTCIWASPRLYQSVSSFVPVRAFLAEREMDVPMDQAMMARWTLREALMKWFRLHSSSFFMSLRLSIQASRQPTLFWMTTSRRSVL